VGLRITGGVYQRYTQIIVIPANCKRARNETGCLCVRQDARSQISTALLAAREKGRFRSVPFSRPSLNGVKLAKGDFFGKAGTLLSG
jgi:hypothetical protein